MTVALPARAKLNLELNVLARRDDGYHQIETTFDSISLHDLVIATPAAATNIRVTGFAVPEDGSNLVLRAVAALEEIVGRALPTSFRLLKRIPPGAGFGGGSSDAATALRALREIHGLEDIDLVPIARRLGADVPYFLHGGRALGTGRGDELRQIPHRQSWYALAWPAFELETTAVYEAWDSTRGELLEAAATVEPRVARFRDRLGDGWQMTGTGSAFFLPVADATEASRAIADLRCWTAVAHSVPAWG